MGQSIWELLTTIHFFGLTETALDSETFRSRPPVAPQPIAPQQAAPQPNGADIPLHAPLPLHVVQQTHPLTAGAGPPPSTIEGERSSPTIEEEQQHSSPTVEGEQYGPSQGEHVISTEKTMGDDNFNIFQDQGCPASENQQPEIVSGINQNDIVEVISIAVEEHQLQRPHIWTRDHPPYQIIGNPNAGVQTRSAKESADFCLHSAFLSIIKPKTLRKLLSIRTGFQPCKKNLLNLNGMRFGS